MDILKGFSHLTHASVRFQGEKIIYIDPYQVSGTPGDADFIFCTHDHFDHLNKEDIEKVMKPGSILVVPQKNTKTFKKWDFSQVIGAKPGETYEAGGLKFKTLAAYNINKKFHPKKEKWMGFILYLKDSAYYIAGDTDFIPEMKEVEADAVFLPVGGTYTMDALEAAKAANFLKPKAAVPIHFGSVVGSRQDAQTFLDNLDPGIHGEILMK